MATASAASAARAHPPGANFCAYSAASRACGESPPAAPPWHSRHQRAVGAGGTSANASASAGGGVPPARCAARCARAAAAIAAIWSASRRAAPAGGRGGAPPGSRAPAATAATACPPQRIRPRRSVHAGAPQCSMCASTRSARSAGAWRTPSWRPHPGAAAAATAGRGRELDATMRARHARSGPTRASGRPQNAHCSSSERPLDAGASDSSMAQPRACDETLDYLAAQIDARTPLPAFCLAAAPLLADAALVRPVLEAYVALAADAPPPPPPPIAAPAAEAALARYMASVAATDASALTADHWRALGLLAVPRGAELLLDALVGDTRAFFEYRVAIAADPVHLLGVVVGEDAAAVRDPFAAWRARGPAPAGRGGGPRRGLGRAARGAGRGARRVARPAARGARADRARPPVAVLWRCTPINEDAHRAQRSRGKAPNVFVVDEFYFVANTDVLLAGMKNYGRALIALSSTHGVPNTLNNPLPAMSVAPTDANGHPTQRATFARRCAACARLRRPFCPHTPLSVPWQRHSEAGDQEHDVVLTAPGGPLLSGKARMRMVGPGVGAPVARAPLVVGLDPGGGRSQTAGVALRLHERGCAVVGVLASTREAGQHLADAAQFVADVAEQHGLVVVY